VKALALTSVEGWTLATSGFADGQPRVRDIELAEHLGYERPAKIRDLLQRLAPDGNLSGSEVFTTVGKTSRLGGRPSRECWLTESQALKVVAKSETPLADAILDEVLSVFLAVRHGSLVPQPAPLDVQMRALFAEMVAPTLALMNTVLARFQDMSGATISDADWRWLRAEVCRIAKLRVSGNPNSRGENSERRIIYNKLGAGVAFTGRGAHWRVLPLSKVAEAKVALAEMRADAERHVPAPRQLSLLGGHK
jgi:hypothetical protein